MLLSFIRTGFSLFAFGFLVVMVACKNGPDGPRPDSAGVKMDSPWVGGMIDTLQGVIPADRPSLIATLKAMGRALNSGDRRQVAGIFSFPIPDSVAHFYLDDTTFRGGVDRNGGITEVMFDHYYEGIYKSVDFGEFGEVFRELNMDKLMKTNGLEIRTDTVTEPCTRKYRIEVEQDSLVRIEYGVSSVNSDYKPASTKDSAEHSDDYGEGACEHVTFWNFVWDGHRLRLTRQDAAD